MHLGRSCGTREVLDKGVLVGAPGNLNRISTKQNDSGGHSTMANGTMAPGATLSSWLSDTTRLGGVVQVWERRETPIPEVP